MRNLTSLIFLFALLQHLSAQPACVTEACCCGDPLEVGIPNGNFEDPPNAPLNGRITFFAGETYSTWSVLGGSIDLLGPNYSNFTAGNPNGPSQFIDLNGFAPGTIATNLTGLMPGSVYTIVLWYAKNPGGPSASCNIQVAGGAWLNASWTSTNNGGDFWLEKCFTFTAQAASAELRFIGSSPMPTAGMLLDNMTMWKCPMDNQAPVVVTPPISPLNVECSDPVPAPVDPQFSDNCSNALTIALTEQTVPQTCFYSLVRTWVATDECGNSRTVTQLVRVLDTQAPEFTIPPADFSLPCGEDYGPAFFNWLATFGGGQATDNCDPDVTWSYSYQQAPNGFCRVTPVTFTIRDDCGNARTITANFIIEDTEPPLLLLEAENDTVWCSNSATGIFNQWLLQHGGALAEDPCGPVTWTHNFTGNPANPVIQVTFTATDRCQNSVTTTATFYQPEVSDTLYQAVFTCDPQLVGTDTILLVQGNCDFFTITTTSLVPGNTVYLMNQVCDPALVGADTLYLNNQFGCDSIVYTTTALLPSDTILLSGQSCDLTQAGVFVQNLSNQNGCDSLIITTIALLPPDTTALWGASCDPAQAGVFVQNLANQNGCDSLVISTIVLLASDTTLLSGVSCDPSQAGVFIQNLDNQFGCDSTVIETVVLVQPDTTLLPGVSCDPSQVGVFIQNLGNLFGCDSTVIETIALLPSDTTLLSGTSCDPTQTGVFVQNLSNQYGCDSTVISTVILLPEHAVHFTSVTCDPSQAGVFTYPLTNQFGCDSIVTETVILAAADTILRFDKSCNPANTGVFSEHFLNQYGCDSTVITAVSFALSDTTYLNLGTCDPAAAGIFAQNLVTPEGCDSVVITSVDLLPADTHSFTTFTCDPALAGVFTYPLTNQYGCDSTVTETAVLLPRDTTYLSGSTCNAAQAGVFMQQLLNQSGCDSTVISTMAFAPLDTVFLTGTTCDPVGAGLFTQHLFTPEGCDSVVVTSISLLTADAVNLTASTCDPAAAGMFTYAFTNQFGCDSIVTETVALLPSDTLMLFGSSCNLAQAGVFTQHLASQAGCDSTVISTIAFAPLDTVFLTGTTCDPTGAGLFTQHLSTPEGCDSVVVTSINLLPADAVNLTASTCDPAQAGVATQQFTNQFGCDSVVVTTTTLAPPPQLTVNISNFNGFGISCFGDADGSASAAATGFGPFSYAWSNGGSGPAVTGLAAGLYTVTVTDNNGCTAAITRLLDAPEPLQLIPDVSHPNCLGTAKGAIRFETGGGVPPYRYSLDGLTVKTDPVFTGLTPGPYQGTAQDANGCLSTVAAVIEAPEPVAVTLGDDILIELGDLATLQASVSVSPDSLTSVVWSGIDSPACPSCLSHVVSPLRTRAYAIRVVAGNGCSDTDTVLVLVDRSRRIYAPNAFSPGSAGENNLFMLFSKPGVVRTVKSFRVFDRWGEAVCQFEDIQPNNPDFSWDGTLRGQPLNPGVFVWLAEIEFMDGETELFTGDVLLVR